MKANYEKAPDILKEKIDEVFEKAVYCQTTCKVRKISELDKASIIESCQEGEQEVVLNIKGKDALKFKRYLAAKVISEIS